MRIVSIFEAKTDLSKLVDQATAGEDVIIGRNGKPVARITALATVKKTIRFGVLKRKVKVARDLYAPLPDDLLAAFEGRS